jgi:hypothetical protein
LLNVDGRNENEAPAESGDRAGASSLLVFLSGPAGDQDGNDRTQQHRQPEVAYYLERESHDRDAREDRDVGTGIHDGSNLAEQAAERDDD